MNSTTCKGALYNILERCLLRSPGLLLILLFLMMPEYRTAAQEHGEIFPERIPIHGTCVEFIGHRDIDETSTHYKSGMVDKGISVKASLNPSEPYLTKERLQRVKCACTNKIYNDLDICLKECRITLACFTGICGPYDYKEGICLSSKFKTIFSLSLKSSVLYWLPHEKISDACKKMKDDYEREVFKHERQHILDIQEVFEKYKKTWPEIQIIEVCGESEIEVKQKFNKKLVFEIEQPLYELVEKMEREIDKKAAILDQIKTGAKMDCSVCP